MNDGNKKEEIRQEMIKWGENQRNNVDKYIFCQKVVEKLRKKDSKAKLWIVVDCRRITDLEYFFKFKCNVMTVRIESLLHVRKERGYVFCSNIDDSESECNLDTFLKWDFLFENNCMHNHFKSNIIENDNCLFIETFFNLCKIISYKL